MRLTHGQGEGHAPGSPRSGELLAASLRIAQDLQSSTEGVRQEVSRSTHLLRQVRASLRELSESIICPRVRTPPPPGVLIEESGLELLALLEAIRLQMAQARDARMTVTAASSACMHGWGLGPSSEEIIQADALAESLEKKWEALEALLRVRTMHGGRTADAGNEARYGSTAG
jgi:hypothetical protein